MYAMQDTNRKNIRLFSISQVTEIILRGSMQTVLGLMLDSFILKIICANISNVKLL